MDRSATGQEYYSWDGFHTYWLNAYELDPVVRWQRKLGEGQLIQARVDVPLFAIVSRLPRNRYNDEEADYFWLVHSHDDMSLTSVNKYLSLTARLGY